MTGCPSRVLALPLLGHATISVMCSILVATDDTTYVPFHSYCDILMCFVLQEVAHSVKQADSAESSSKAQTRRNGAGDGEAEALAKEAASPSSACHQSQPPPQSEQALPGTQPGSAGSSPEAVAEEQAADAGDDVDDDEAADQICAAAVGAAVQAGPKAVVELMDQHTKDARWSWWCAEGVSSLAAGNRMCAHRATRTALAPHSHPIHSAYRPAPHTHTVYVLTAEAQEELVELGAVRLVIGNMIRHAWDATVQYKGSSALCCFAATQRTCMHHAQYRHVSVRHAPAC